MEKTSKDLCSVGSRRIRLMFSISGRASAKYQTCISRAGCCVTHNNIKLFITFFPCFLSNSCHCGCFFFLSPLPIAGKGLGCRGQFFLYCPFGYTQYSFASLSHGRMVLGMQSAALAFRKILICSVFFHNGGNLGDSLMLSELEEESIVSRPRSAWAVVGSEGRGTRG